MEPYIGTIMIFGFNFAPVNWAFCDGRLLPVSSNTALFSLLGATYGGNGTTTFGLPDLRCREIVGQGPSGSTNFLMGSFNTHSSVTLTAANLPSHNHAVAGQLLVSGDPGSGGSPDGAYLAAGPQPDYAARAGSNMFAASSTAATVGNMGSSTPISTQGPVLAMNYCIALNGIYPTRP